MLYVAYVQNNREYHHISKQNGESQTRLKFYSLIVLYSHHDNCIYHKKYLNM